MKHIALILFPFLMLSVFVSNQLTSMNGFINLKECPICGEIYCSDYSTHECANSETAEENNVEEVTD